MVSYNSAFLYASFMHDDDDDPVLDTPLWELADDLDSDGGQDWMSRDGPIAEEDPPVAPSPAVPDAVEGATPTADGGELPLKQAVAAGVYESGDSGWDGGANGDGGYGYERGDAHGSVGGAGAEHGRVVAAENSHGSEDFAPTAGGVDVAGGWARNGVARGDTGWQQVPEQEQQRQQEEDLALPPWQAEAEPGLGWASTGGPGAGVVGGTPFWEEQGESWTAGPAERAPPFSAARPVTGTDADAPPSPEDAPYVADWFDEEFGERGEGAGEVERNGEQGGLLSSGVYEGGFEEAGVGNVGAGGREESGGYVYGGSSTDESGRHPSAGIDPVGAWGYPPPPLHHEGAAGGGSAVGVPSPPSADVMPPQGEGWSTRSTGTEAATAAARGSLVGGEKPLSADGEEADVVTEDVAGADAGGLASGTSPARARRRRTRHRRYLDLEVFCDDEDGEELRLPPVRLDMRSASRGAGAEAGGEESSATVKSGRDEGEGGRGAVWKVARGAWTALRRRLATPDDVRNEEESEGWSQSEEVQ